MSPALAELIRGARIYDLAQPYFPGMPHYPTHPPFLYGLTKRHGDFVNPGGSSSAADAIALGTHVGTHIDALCHFSQDGVLRGGALAEDCQSYAGGVELHGIDCVAPIWKRGVLLDVASFLGCGSLSEDFSIPAELLEKTAAAEGVEVHEGDVVLIRTGWGGFFEDPRKFLRGMKGPGPELDGARWLSARRIFAAGSDTVAFERIPAPSMPVHVHLLVESGIHILEVLNLEGLARDQVWEFLFAAAPLKIRNATGAPVRPLAVVL